MIVRFVGAVYEVKKVLGLNRGGGILQPTRMIASLCPIPGQATLSWRFL